MLYPTILFPDADTAHYFGRAYIGYEGATSDYPAFGHRDCRNASQYAFKQGPLSQTYINTGSGQIISFRVANATMFYITGHFFLPIGTNTEWLGDGTYYFNDVNSKDFVDRSALSIFDREKSYNLICDLQNETEGGHCKKIEDLGMMRMNYGQIASIFPHVIDLSLEEAPEDIVLTNDIEIDECTFISQNCEIPTKGSKKVLARKGEMTRYRLREHDGIKKIALAAEGASLSGMISVLYGALQKATEKIESLETRLNKLEVA